MKNFMKKVLAGAMAFALVAAGVAVAPSTAEAAGTATSITSVVFSFTSDAATTYVAQYTDWSSSEFAVAAGTADYDASPEAAQDGMTNLGYISTDVVASVTVDKVTINGYVFTDTTLLSMSLAVTADDDSANCIWNEWMGDEHYGTVASDDGAAYLDLTSSGAYLYVNETATETTTEETTTEETTTTETTTTTSSYSPVGTAYVSMNGDSSICAWAGTNWGDETTTYDGVAINGNGTYTATLDLATIGATATDVTAANGNSCLFLIITCDDAAEMVENLVVSSLVVTVDGVDTTIDTSKIAIFEEDSACRIAIMSPWYNSNAGLWAMDDFSVSETISITVTLGEAATSTSTVTTAKTGEASTVVLFVVAIAAVAGVAFSMKKAR